MTIHALPKRSPVLNLKVANRNGIPAWHDAPPQVRAPVTMQDWMARNDFAPTDNSSWWRRFFNRQGAGGAKNLPGEAL